MDLQLDNLNAIVTGGTRGIGKAIVDILVKEGATVSFCARDDGVVQARNEALANSGADALGAAVDVTDGTSLASWIDRSATRMGGFKNTAVSPS